MTWGAPGDANPGCRNRDQVLAWYGQGRANGVRATVTLTVVHDRQPTFDADDVQTRQALDSMGVSRDHAVPDSGITDDELTELALAADPSAPLPEDAVPIGVHLSRFTAPLPLWYMPPAVRSGGRRWRAPVVLAVVSAFLLIDAMGLCNTYGILSLA